MDPGGVGGGRLEAEWTQEEEAAPPRFLFLSLSKLMHKFQSVYATYAVIIYFPRFWVGVGGEGGEAMGTFPMIPPCFFFTDPCQPSDLVAVRF